MIEKAKVTELAQEYLEDTDKFVTDIQVKTGNIITVVIDGDSSVIIKDCIRLSKFIEGRLDRDTEDYDLRVTSFGADKPLKLKRQYKKNIGREFNIVLADETRLTGKLIDADEAQITVMKKDEKRKGRKPEEVKISFNDIKEAIIVLSFK